MQKSIELSILYEALAPVKQWIKQFGEDGVFEEAAVDMYSEQSLSHQTVSPFPGPENIHALRLTELCQRLNLNSAERDLLLLCVGMEIDPEWPLLCALAHRNKMMAHPTFRLAQNIIPTLTPKSICSAGSLRYWGVIHLGQGLTAFTSPLILDESILHYLLGNTCLPEALAGSFKVLPSKKDTLSSSQQTVVEEMMSAWVKSTRVFQLCGTDCLLQSAIASYFCHGAEIALYRLSVETLPSSPEDFRMFMRLWQREVKLNDYALLINWNQSNINSNIKTRLSVLVETTEGPIIVMTSDRIDLPATSVHTATVAALTQIEQRLLWADTLSNCVAESQKVINNLVNQFNLTAANILDATTYAPIDADAQALQEKLWLACRIQARPQLDSICQRIETKETWEDLVLPEEQKRVLETIVAHNQQRSTVYEDWGFSSKSSRGLGTTALFSGPSGTGKTMAANVIAQTLNLDLYKVDLSTVVSKYIGETEKNLKQIFDAAESGGVILLFDEADAIFGKRSEVKDARDRYANMEVSYLLQRMESYRGLAILTTNMPGAIDQAFIRRIRFITRFPLPDYEQRKAIWQRVFPSAVPMAKDVDPRKLARLGVAGGTIRSIALSAAFLAASEAAAEKKQPAIAMKHIYNATEAEYNKIQQPMPDEMTRGWID